MAPRNVFCFRAAEAPAGLDLEKELDRLYGGRYASLAHVEIYHPGLDLLVYAARDGGQLVSALLFRIDQRKITVQAEGIALAAADIEAFASYAFEQFPAVSAVSFRFVEAGAGPYTFASHWTPADTDMVVPLPATVEQYRASLGASTRHNLNKQLNKFRRDYPGFRLDVHERQAVPQELVRRIIALQRTRMADVGKVSMVGEDEERRVCAYVARRGFVVALSVDCKLVAGTINYRLGRHVAACIAGHELAFMKYHIGLLCAYLTICECIRTGAADLFCFGWGHDGYKYRLGGIARELSCLTLYRTRAHMLWHPGLALRDAWRGQVCRARRWAVAAATRHNSLAGRLLGRGRTAMTRLRKRTARRSARPASPSGREAADGNPSTTHGLQ